MTAKSNQVNIYNMPIIDYKFIKELKFYINIMSTESVFFQDPPNYPNLEQYKEFCWQNSIDQYLQTYQLSPSLPMHQQSTYPIQPQDKYQRSEVEQQNNLLFTEISFNIASRDTLQHQNCIQNDLDSSVEGQMKNSKEIKGKSKKTHNNTQKKEKTYNTADYIIKQCFKALLSQEYAAEISSYCKDENVSYASLVLFLKRGILKNKSKHIGVNHFYKFVVENDVFVSITKKFLVRYLWSDYGYYVLMGNMQNKQEYLECATKLLYIAKIESHETQQNEDAQKVRA